MRIEKPPKTGSGSNSEGKERHPIHDAGSGERVGYTEESWEKRISNGEHQWTRENADGSTTPQHYTTDEDNW